MMPRTDARGCAVHRMLKNARTPNSRHKTTLPLLQHSMGPRQWRPSTACHLRASSPTVGAPRQRTRVTSQPTANSILPKMLDVLSRHYFASRCCNRSVPNGNTHQAQTRWPPCVLQGCSANANILHFFYTSHRMHTRAWCLHRVCCNAEPPMCTYLAMACNRRVRTIVCGSFVWPQSR
jgi:hypothetical protein